MTTRHLFAGAIALAVAILVPNRLALAEWSPSKPITIVVPFSAGGVNDIVTRAVAARLAPAIGQAVIVENKTGAAGTLAMTAVAKSRPDGLTLIMACSACLTITPHLPSSPLEIDPLTAFAPVSFVARSPLVLVANPKIEAKSMADLITLAKSQPGKLSYGTIGVGSITHLAAVLLENVADIRMQGIPYRGTGGGALTDLISGQVNVMFDAPETSGPQIKAGHLRLLGVTGKRRLESWPDVPTIAESGFPGYNVELWFALLAPAGTPSEAVSYLNREVRKILEDPSFRAPFHARGLEVVGSSPEELKAVMVKESQNWRDVIQKSAAFK